MCCKLPKKVEFRIHCAVACYAKCCFLIDLMYYGVTVDTRGNTCGKHPRTVCRVIDCSFVCGRSPSVWYRDPREPTPCHQSSSSARRHRPSHADDVISIRLRRWLCSWRLANTSSGTGGASGTGTLRDGGGGWDGSSGVCRVCVAVIGNDSVGPTSASSLLQTRLQPPPPTPLVGQPNGTVGPITVDGVSIGSGADGGDGGAFDDGYWWWALLAVFLVLATAAGNILVCLAITWERRLQNVTNYFLMSLAVTDLMVAVLVMPVGILTLVKGTCSAFNVSSKNITIFSYHHIDVTSCLKEF
ncbi:G protein-coupled receptor, rhodopsin-like,GPCR, rhodopsin-like, 7TM [Cinara cedri]|uniref:G protein-coupled receptor, rhodopsin-like,GPCR, rhodopsin-like, 7TM n=1 Tax=Cinara cedri TaxID=506608 RepID=A0A5E4MEG5_9HEMI|nr:G protein-coupled receptor, rhodopsin-like,GPCR, rhodopsin-like, 7TM [Cinara cedri]